MANLHEIKIYTNQNNTNIANEFIENIKYKLTERLKSELLSDKLNISPFILMRLFD